MFGQLGVVLLGKIWGKWLRRKYRRIQGQIGELLGVYVNDVVQLYRIGGGDFSADKHRDVADRIRKVADEDPAHRKIFVHGLGWDTTAETLTSVFKQFGEIEDCKAVCDKISGKSKGYGFILFKSRRGARNALKQPQKKIGNRMTACQLATIGPVPMGNSAAVAATSSVAAPAAPLSEYTQKKIYVSNVGAELDPRKLLAFFARYGEIEEGPLGLDKVTGKPKGFSPGTGPGHLMAPAAAGAGMGYNQGAAAAQALNPALGQAITALLASQGAGLGLTNLLGTLGSAAAAVNPGVPAAAGHGMQGAYPSQTNISPGVIGGYGNQGGLQGGYPSQQMGQGGSGRGQHGAGQYGNIAPYMGH
ncbi:ubp1-associated protein 2b [Quercus suber]|uniref:Ubp1-associated protein 2b n=1 Tax=Quercus suber TaxID=58331 RepID=A0AAW0J841_QUESU